MAAHTEDDSPRLTENLQQWAAQTYGSGAQVSGVESLGGHAGYNFRFDVVTPGEGTRELVIRLAPPSKRAGGPADVLRQVPLLTALDAAGFPVAPVVWASENDHPFGTDAVIQHRFGAKSIDMFRDEPTSLADITAHRAPWRHGIKTLARLHEFDWKTRLSQWARPQELHDVTDLIGRILDKAPEPTWSAQGTDLLNTVSSTLTDSGPLGLIHGDFQTNNILFGPSGTVVAVVDWELADIGPLELDLGWAAMMSDPEAWHDDLSSRLRVQADPEEVFAWYGKPESARLWRFYALACLRYGAIAGYNIHLSRSGRRPDAFNESMSSTVPVLFRRGFDALTRATDFPD